MVLSGVGGAGSSITKMLSSIGSRWLYGFQPRDLERKKGGRYQPLYKGGGITNHDQGGSPAFEEAMAKADIFVGVSVAGKVTKEMVKSMKKDPIIFCHGQSGAGDHL